MITEHGWLPRNTVVTLDLSDRGEKRADGKRYWEVLVWTKPGEPIKCGGWGFAQFPYLRCRSHGPGAPWAYQTAKQAYLEREERLSQ